MCRSEQADEGTRRQCDMPCGTQQRCAAATPCFLQPAMTECSSSHCLPPFSPFPFSLNLSLSLCCWTHAMKWFTSLMSSNKNESLWKRWYICELPYSWGDKAEKRRWDIKWGEGEKKGGHVHHTAYVIGHEWQRVWRSAFFYIGLKERKLSWQKRHLYPDPRMTMVKFDARLRKIIIIL